MIYRKEVRLETDPLWCLGRRECYRWQMHAVDAWLLQAAEAMKACRNEPSSQNQPSELDTPTQNRTSDLDTPIQNRASDLVTAAGRAAAAAIGRAGSASGSAPLDGASQPEPEQEQPVRRTVKRPRIVPLED
eukprot:826089-Rhodomonas_salina.1